MFGLLIRTIPLTTAGGLALSGTILFGGIGVVLLPSLLF
jgi:hypothetical protein